MKKNLKKSLLGWLIASPKEKVISQKYYLHKAHVQGLTTIRVVSIPDLVFAVTGFKNFKDAKEFVDDTDGMSLAIACRDNNDTHYKISPSRIITPFSTSFANDVENWTEFNVRSDNQISELVSFYIDNKLPETSNILKLLKLVRCIKKEDKLYYQGSLEQTSPLITHIERGINEVEKKSPDKSSLIVALPSVFI